MNTNLHRLKDHIGQGQIRIPKKDRWAHNNAKLLHCHSELFCSHGLVIFFLIICNNVLWLHINDSAIYANIFRTLEMDGGRLETRKVKLELYQVHMLR